MRFGWFGLLLVVVLGAVFLRSLGGGRGGPVETPATGSRSDDSVLVVPEEPLEPAFPSGGGLEESRHLSTEPTGGGPAARASGNPDPVEARTIEVRTAWEHMDGLGPKPEHVRLIDADGRERVPLPRLQGTWFPFVFDDLEPREYTVRIDDPRFENWEALARPGDDIEARLVGASAVALRVLGTDGEWIERFGVSVELLGVSFSPSLFEVNPGAVERAEGVLQLIPGDHRVRVNTGDRLGAVEIVGLLPGETRPVDVLLGSESRVSGRVTYSDGAPATDVKVALLPIEPGATEPPGGDSWVTAAFVDSNIERKSPEDDGSYAFATALRSEHVVCAWAPNGSEAVSPVLRLGSGQSCEGVDLVVPRGGFVHGRIIGPEGASCAGLRVRAATGLTAATGRRPGPLTTLRRMMVSQENVRPVSDSCGFEVGPLPPGPTVLRLLLPESRIPSRIGWSNIGSSGPELGTVEVVDGERIERDFVVDAFPGTLTLVVDVNGTPRSGLNLRLDARLGEVAVSCGGSTRRRGEFGPEAAFPGEWWLRVDDPDHGWRYWDPSPIHVQVGESTTASVSIEVAEAELRFLDAGTGAPLAGARLALHGRASDNVRTYGAWTWRELDDEGRAAWTLPPGEYRFRLDPPGNQPPDPVNGRTAIVVWTTRGPVESDVRL